MIKTVPKLIFAEVEGTLALVGAYALTFTPQDISAMLVAVTALVTALGIAIVNIIAARAVARKVDAASVKIDEVQAQGKLIEGHVNSAASASAAKIAGLEKEIALLRDFLSNQKEVAALLAQAATSPVVPVNDKIHEKIEDLQSQVSVETRAREVAATESAQRQTTRAVQETTAAVDRNTEATEALNIGNATRSQKDNTSKRKR